MHGRFFLILTTLLSFFFISFVSNNPPILKNQNLIFDLHWDCIVCGHWVSNTKNYCPYCGHYSPNIPSD